MKTDKELFTALLAGKTLTRKSNGNQVYFNAGGDLVGNIGYTVCLHDWEVTSVVADLFDILVKAELCYWENEKTICIGHRITVLADNVTIVNRIVKDCDGICRAYNKSGKLLDEMKSFTINYVM